MKTVAVMPAYNEEKTIYEMVKKTKQYVNKIIVVDDGSSDNTAKLAKLAGAVVIRHKKNMGLGSAIRTGLERARKFGADITITLDADGQHNPKDIKKFIEKINQGYDFVLGKRNLSKYPFYKKLGNLSLSFMINLISGTALLDTESGYRAFSKNCLKKIKLQAKKYEIAADIIFQIGKYNLRACNVNLSPSIYRRGRGVTVFDGFKNFFYLLRRRKRNIKEYLKDFKYVVIHAARSMIKWLIE